MSFQREPRFSDFHELTARRDSRGCVNSAEHEVRAGDSIGYSRRHRLTCCATCWRAWSAENAAAALDEAQARDSMGGAW